MQNSINYINSKLSSNEQEPVIGLVLGSGLGDIANEINGVRLPYSEIPGFEASNVQGHANQLVIGELLGKKVVAMQGRFHFYEGYSMSKITYPIKVMKKLGVKTLIVTNAAGGVNESYKPGDLMIINDHINNMGTNPLIGENDDDLGPRFPDMSTAYNKDLIKLTYTIAAQQGLSLKEGVYAGGTGPSYETPAEIKMLRIWGADAVGMSTVPEVITANYMGLKVLGISCITNMAAGILDQPLDHQEVIETTEKVKQDFIGLIKGIIKNI